MAKIFDRVKVNVSTPGQGTVTFGSKPSTAFYTPAEAGAVDGDEVEYVITEGADEEHGIGTIGGGATTASRDTVLKSIIAGNVGTAKMSLNGGATFVVTATSNAYRSLRNHRSVTAATDTIANGDGGCLIAYNSAAAVAVSIAQAATSGQFLKGWFCYLKNINTGDVTVTPATSTIEGSASFVLKSNQAAMLYSTGTSYRVLVFRNDFGTAAVRADTDFPRTDVAQTLNATQKALVRANIGAPWEPISSASAAGATAALVSLPSGYSQFKLVVQNINPSAAATLYGQLSPNGGTSFDGGSTDYNYQMTKHAGSNIITSNADSNIIVFASNIAASARGQIEITIDPGSGSQFPNMFWQSAFLDGSTNKVDLINGAAMRSTTGRYSALNFITNSGTFVTCDVYLLGRR